MGKARGQHSKGHVSGSIAGRAPLLCNLAEQRGEAGDDTQGKSSAHVVKKEGLQRGGGGGGGAGGHKAWADAVGPEVHSEISREERKLMQEMERFKRMEGNEQRGRLEKRGKERAESAVSFGNIARPRGRGGEGGAVGAGLGRVKREVVEETGSPLDDPDLAAAIALSLKEQDTPRQGEGDVRGHVRVREAREQESDDAGKTRECVEVIEID